MIIRSDKKLRYQYNQNRISNILGFRETSFIVKSSVTITTATVRI
jgi:hypothetical protein